MTLAHVRDRYLQLISNNLNEMTFSTFWQITLSRPSIAVLKVVDKLVQKAHGHVRIEVLEGPFNPLQAGQKERFMELRQWQLERLAPSDWGSIWDDDQYFPNTDEIRHTLVRPDVDMVYATKRYFWDNPNTCAVHLPTHRSVHFFRRTSTERFPVDRTINAPLPIHDKTKKIVDLETKLHDFGYYTEVDRQRCWRDYKGVGKIDPLTMGLITPPTLEDV